MNRRRFACAVALVAALGVAGSHTSHVQENTAVDHAKRVLDLLGHDKFDEVAGEFNVQVAAAMSASQLRVVWSTLRQQVGAFTSFIDQRVTTPAAGITAVICRGGATRSAATLA